MVFSAQSGVGCLALCNLRLFPAQSGVGCLTLRSLEVFFAQTWVGSVSLCSFGLISAEFGNFLYLCGTVNTFFAWGCHSAEIIPFKPDAVSTAVGKAWSTIHILRFIESFFRHPPAYKTFIL